MKRTILTFAILIFCFLAKINAQNPVATLEHGEQTIVYYGNNALIEAHNAAVNGDAIYLSSGTFNGTTITKMLNITGVGHYPDSVNVFLRTIVTNISFGQGSDSSKIEGLYITGNAEFAADKHLTKIKVNRCSIQDYKFNSNAQTTSKDFCSITQSVVRGHVYCSNYCNTLYIKNCIVNGTIRDVIGNSSCFVENNVLLLNWTLPGTFDTGTSFLFNNIYNSIIQNNVVYQPNGSKSWEGFKSSWYIFANCGNNFIANNIFLTGNFDFGTNHSQNNWFGVTQSSIFVAQSGNVFDYNHNYHLKEPAKYIGSDGTQVGIYGGDTPYKEKALPVNPHVVSKKIPFKTDAEGNLQINMTIKAQEN